MTNHTTTAVPKAKKPVELLRNEEMGPEWSHVSKGGKVVKFTPKEVQHHSGSESNISYTSNFSPLANYP
jgi:hypothetical protein